MNKTVYFLRKRKIDRIVQQLMNNYDLELCLISKEEIILKNNEFLITCKKKYISILIYNDYNEKEIYKIAKFFKHSKRKKNGK